MSFPRLKERIQSADKIGVYTLEKHALRFHKLSKKDGSGKCDAWFTGNSDDYVIGVVFEISDAEKEKLDWFEGLGNGYQDKEVLVGDVQGNTIEAITYYATNTDSSLVPYTWYLYHVVYGAKESGIPNYYINAIEGTSSIEDPDKERDAKERAIYS